MTQYEYNKNIRIYEQEHWRGFREESKNVPDTSRLHKILAKNPGAHLKLTRFDDGVFAEDEEEKLTYLIEVHFPGFQRTQIDREEEGWNHEREKPNRILPPRTLI